MIMKQSKEKFDFKAFGQAIKAARKAKGISRNQLADTLNIEPRYIASIENSGQHPSLQILYELVTLLDVSVPSFEVRVCSERRAFCSKAASTAALSKLSPSFRAVMGFVRSGVR